MKIKRLAAMALAGTMVFSMAACSDSGKKESNNATTNNETTKDEGGNNEAGNVPVEDVIEAYKMYVENDGKNYSYNTTQISDVDAEGFSVYMEEYIEAKSFDNVTYTKTTYKTNLLGTDEEYVEEALIIVKEDGSEVRASKSGDEDEWSVGVITTSELIVLEALNDREVNVDEVKKSAKMESKGDECYVTMKLETDEVEIEDKTGSFKADVIVTYNTKENVITDIEYIFDLESINEYFSDLDNMVYNELEVKINNIKKMDKPIEIPAEIELD